MSGPQAIKASEGANATTAAVAEAASAVDHDFFARVYLGTCMGYVVLLIVTSAIITRAGVRRCAAMLEKEEEEKNKIQRALQDSESRVESPAASHRCWEPPPKKSFNALCKTQSCATPGRGIHGSWQRSLALCIQQSLD